MNSALLLVAFISYVKADFAQDASAVIETASELSSLVNGWDQGQGLSGALAIQQTYDPLSQAVETLNGSADNAEVNDASVKALGDLAAGITSLLNVLTEKAGDFSAVGASQIVQGDISKLAGPSGEIVSKVYEKGKSQCEYIESLKEPLSSLDAAFSSAAESFSASAPSFPEITCEGGSSASASASESGSASASASASESGSASASKSESKSSASGSGSAKPSASASGSAKSSASGSSKPSASSSEECECKSSAAASSKPAEKPSKAATSVAVSNGANTLGSGLVAMVIAMLM